MNRELFLYKSSYCKCICLKIICLKKYNPKEVLQTVNSLIFKILVCFYFFMKQGVDINIVRCWCEL